MENDNPLDQPGGPPLEFDPARDPAAPSLNYRRERLNQVMRRGGRGCMLWAIGVALLPCAVVSIAVLAR